MAATVTLNGAELVLDPSGALWWREAATLAVADVHFARDSRYALPGKPAPLDPRAGLERLSLVLRRYRPRRVVALGEGAGRAGAGERLDGADLARLSAMEAEHEWVWIARAHQSRAAAGAGGIVAQELALGPLVFRHEPATGDAVGEVCGHFHPKAAVRVRGRRVSGRCFVTDGTRLILPAFGAYTGGLDALDPEVLGLFGGPIRVYLIAREGIYLFAADRLEAPRRTEAVALGR